MADPACPSDEALLARLGALWPAGVPVRPAGIAVAPSDKGAYVLLIELAEPAAFTLGRQELRFSAGWHAYAGSARGPGGLRARLARHFRRDKAPHWHVDRLTIRAAQVLALALPDGAECAIRARLAAEGWEAGPAGFGSSDCRHCPSHILKAPVTPGLDESSLSSFGVTASG